MLELLVRAYIEDRRRELDDCLRAAEATKFARLSGTGGGGWFRRHGRPNQRASRASSAAFAPGHSASTNE